MIRRRAALLGVLAALCAAPVARAAEPAPVVLLPTTARTAPLPPARQRRDVEQDNAALTEAARQLDLVLAEAVQDLGLTLDLSPQTLPAAPTEEALAQGPAPAWVIAPEVFQDRGDLVVRIVAVAPGSQVLLSRRQRVEPGALEVQAMRLLRDVVEAGGSVSEEPARAASAEAPASPASRARSSGRAVLALHGTALGGLAGYAVQRAGGGDDARLTYPLTALGAGIGLGASMVVADEWDVRVGDAWYLASGLYWPGAGGLLLARGYSVEPEDNRYLYGLLGATGGLGLATVATAFGHIDVGGATLAQSGGLFGTFFGALVQAGVAGSTTEPLYLGLGYGALGGALAGGVAGAGFEGTSSRVLFVDLLAGLGGLGGAALASPLLVGEQQTATETRGWLACVAAGTIAGATVGVITTRPKPDAAPAPESATSVLPYGGVIAEGTAPGAPPFLGLGLQGQF